jgi:hypothetical protein
MNESDSLKQQVAALASIVSEFEHMQMVELDPIESQKIFNQKMMVDDIRRMKQRELDDIEAGDEDDTALTAGQAQDLQTALTQLHSFVRNDQAISMGISFLLQIAGQIKNLS